MKTFKQFVNENKRFVNEGQWLQKTKSFIGGIAYAFDIENQESDEQVNVELSVNKGSEIIDQLEEYGQFLDPKITYMSLLLAGYENHEFIFNIKEWYNIVDFFKDAIKEKLDVGSSKFKKGKDSLEVTVQDVLFEEDTVMTFTKKGTSVYWVIKGKSEKFNILMPRDLLNQLNSLKFK